MAEVACIAWLVPLASAKSDDVGNVLLEFDEVTVHMSTNKILQKGKLVNHPIDYGIKVRAPHLVKRPEAFSDRLDEHKKCKDIVPLKRCPVTWDKVMSTHVTAGKKFLKDLTAARKASADVDGVPAVWRKECSHILK